MLWLLRHAFGSFFWVWWPILLGLGLTLALTTSKADILFAQGVFAFSFLLLLIKSAIWLTSPASSSVAPKPLAAALVFGLVGALWIGSFEWVRGKLAAPVQAMSAASPASASETPSPPAPTEPTASVAEEVDVDVDVTPEVLMGFYEGRTDVQGDKQVADYLRRWITVSGPLGNVSAIQYTGEREWTNSARTFMVTFANRGIVIHDLRDVFMRFNEEWFDRLSLLPVGKQISVRGQIIEVTRIGLELWNCGLVDRENPTPSAPGK